MFARVVLALIALIPSAIAGLAQSSMTTVTFGAVTFSHPVEFVVRELGPGTFGVSDPTGNYGVIVITADGLSANGFSPDSTAASIMTVEGHDLMEITGPSTTISLANGHGSMAAAQFTELGSGYMIAVETRSGLILGLVGGDMPSDFVSLAQSIVGSVVVETMLLEPTLAPEVNEADLEADGGVDGACPVSIEEGPDGGTVAFCLGVSLHLPSSWSIADDTLMDTKDIQSVVVNRNEFSATLTTSVNAISPFYNPDTYVRDVVAFIATIAEHTTFSPQEHLRTIIDEPGRTVVTYDSSTYVEEYSEDDVRQLVAIVTLNDDLFVTHVFTWVPSLADDSIEAEIDEIIMSTALADFYDGSPAFVQVDGESLFVWEANWIDSPYSFRPNNEPLLIVMCAPNGVGNEAQVWGSDVYASFSSICLSAVHRGVISLAEGGLVKVKMLPGQESYTGSEANGVRSEDSGAWDESFAVEAFSPASE